MSDTELSSALWGSITVSLRPFASLRISASRSWDIARLTIQGLPWRVKTVSAGSGDPRPARRSIKAEFTHGLIPGDGGLTTPLSDHLPEFGGFVHFGRPLFIFRFE